MVLARGAWLRQVGRALVLGHPCKTSGRIWPCSPHWCLWNGKFPPSPSFPLYKEPHWYREVCLEHARPSCWKHIYRPVALHYCQKYYFSNDPLYGLFITSSFSCLVFFFFSFCLLSFLSSARNQKSTSPVHTTPILFHDCFLLAGQSNGMSPSSTQEAFPLYNLFIAGTLTPQPASQIWLRHPAHGASHRLENLVVRDQGELILLRLPYCQIPKSCIARSRMGQATPSSSTWLGRGQATPPHPYVAGSGLGTSPHPAFCSHIETHSTCQIRPTGWPAKSSGPSMRKKVWASLIYCAAPCSRCV